MFLLPNPIIIIMNLRQYSMQTINATEVLQMFLSLRVVCSQNTLHPSLKLSAYLKILTRRKA